ncbi:hypothetical protein HNR44_002715 [Geomicrobium halophilum]|uniref:Sodium:proton antiporter n=1 Tax=Geomicrobium halophilum TaxID=549000 RepID=A0A841Q0G9_9BACL|nr:SLC13 family permease [Geomicrobium halophilum]MBB6450725.1 hypothetical protein [Geomicrobium halophilum]
MLNAVLISVIVLVVLSLLKVNVIVSLIIAALTAGLLSGISLVETTNMLIDGMGGQAETALSYILLGAFAVTISYSGVTQLLLQNLIRFLKGKKKMIVLVIAGIACLSQNLVPVHIAFIPILIPPLLHLFNKLNVDRRGVATALTFGLKAPYIMLPFGFGFIFHTTIVESMNENGMEISIGETPLATIIPGLGMVVGLFVAVLISYRKDRTYPDSSEDMENVSQDASPDHFSLKHVITIIAIVLALTVQIATDSLVLGALTGIFIMFIGRVIRFHDGDTVVNQGIQMMGMIAFVMLISSGYASILTETGAIEELVAYTTDMIGNNHLMIAIILLLVGLVITMGIGTSFGTIPILAALYVPICAAAGFSPLATAALIGTAGAIGDAGSPVSDSTLGPTAGLNVDGNHHHIWDTCVPTFLHFNIPLFIFGVIAALVL